MRRAVRHQISRTSDPFFTLLFLRASGSAPDIWRSLCEELRTGEGGLVSENDDGRLVAYLHHANRADVGELLARMVEVHPEFAMIEDVVVYSYPAEQADVQRWLEAADAPPCAEVE